MHNNHLLTSIIISSADISDRDNTNDGGREDGVDEDEGANDLSAKAITLGVTVAHVKPLLEALNHPNSTDRPKSLHYNVEDGPRQGQLPSQSSKVIAGLMCPSVELYLTCKRVS